MSVKHSSEVYEQAKEFLRYESETGLFYWKVSKGIARTGMIAGHVDKRGYVSLCINGKLFYAHRLAWVFVFGEYPNEIDHIDHNPQNNRIKNLRNVDHKTNSRNQKISKLNTSSRTGIYWDCNRQKWRPVITINGVQKQLGRFNNFEEAVEARKNYEIKHGFHDNHGNPVDFERITMPERKPRGVSFNKQNKCWIAYMKINGKRKYLGRFKTETEARSARETVELSYGYRDAGKAPLHCEFARKP